MGMEDHACGGTDRDKDLSGMFLLDACPWHLHWARCFEIGQDGDAAADMDDARRGDAVV